LLSFFVSSELANKEQVSNKAEIIFKRPLIPDKNPVYIDGFDDLRSNYIASGIDFIEANLDQMKVRVYKQGMLEKELTIQAKGDPQSWGGSAAGLNQSISKSKLAFSSIAGVYMPYSIKFFGKYYLHGEPFYPRGNKRITDVTGGCIQLPDQDAKSLYQSTEIGTPILVIDKERDPFVYSNKKPKDPPEILAKSYLVADLDSGFIFAEKNSKQHVPIASLAKLMTAVVVTENNDLRKSIKTTASMLDAFGETEKLVANKKFRIVELLYPLLIESSNDAAETLSRFQGKSQTIEIMNEKAQSLLMNNTVFSDPSGYDPANISTGQDLFRLARYILNNRPPLLEITKNNPVPAFGEVSFTDLKNKNLFSQTENFIGGKTGYIVASQYTGLFLFNIPLEGGEKRVAFILLGVEFQGSWEDTLKGEVNKLTDWLKENYSEPTKKPANPVL